MIKIIFFYLLLITLLCTNTLSASVQVQTHDKSPIQIGNHNKVIYINPTTGSSKFSKINVDYILLPTQKNKKHKIQYMAISGMLDTYLQTKINHLLKRKALALYENYSDWDEVEITYKVGFTEFNLLGINIDLLLYNNGAAHPLSETQAFVVNLETGEPFEFKDLFRSGYKDKLNKIIILKLKEMNAYVPCENNMKKICFSTIQDDSQFYLTDTKLALVFSQYQIGPAYLGSFEVDIPYEVLRDMINPNGPLRMFF